MDLDICNWQSFRFGELADSIYKAKAHAKVELTVSPERLDGFIPFVTRTDVNNGVDCYVPRCELANVEQGNAIVIGDTTSTVFYEPDEFGTGEHIIVIRASWLNVYTGLFIVALLQRERFRYSYGRAFLMTSIKDTELRLPVVKGNSGYVPDWQLIEAYVKKLQWPSVTTSNNKKHINLNNCTWGNFSVGSLFSIMNGKGITREEIEGNPGDLVAVQSGEENNGILGKISRDYCVSMNYTVYYGPCLTVARSGSSGFVSFQRNGCVVGDSAKILVLKDKDGASKTGVFLFLQTILSANRFKYAYGRKVTEEKYMNEIIKLPVNSKDSKVPDWEFMDRYIKSLPFGDKV